MLAAPSPALLAVTRSFALATGLLAVGQLPGQAGYAVEVAARTDATLTSIDIHTAINDAGWIAFAGVVSGQGRALVLDPANVRQTVATGAVGATLTGAAINNLTPPEVAYRILVPGPITYIHRATVGGGQVLLGRSPNDFDSATSLVHLNDSGVVTFPGLTQGSTRLVLFAGSTRPPTQHASFPFGFAFRPQIADDGRILIREPTRDIVTFLHANSARDVIAPAGTWSLTGNMPGISRDGRAVGFIGDRGLGKALYVAIRDGAAWSIVPVVGESGAGPFTDFSDGMRVGITSEGDAATEQRITVVYYALAAGVWGIHASDLVIATAAGQRKETIARPARITQVGDVLDGLTVTSLNLMHPVNRHGDVTFWFAHAAGSGVARARRKVRIDRENMRLRSAAATETAPDRWQLKLEMDNDNGDDTLQNTEPDWRRWWHCEVEVFAPTPGETLDVEVSNAGYADVFAPAWSLSSDGGQTFQPYARIPATNLSGQTYTAATTTHSMRIVTPPGVTHLRLAKFLPYTVREKDEWLSRIAGHPRLAITTLPLASEEGRPIHMLEITDRTMPSEGKRRIWIHSGTHPGETTSSFTVEGLVTYLLSGHPAVEGLLDKVIVDIVPMYNPDGVFHGNYRSNAKSKNLEEQWRLADAAKSKETLAVKRQIEAFMGTAQAPGVAPLMVLLNLHSAHNVSYPFHFEHTSNPTAGPSDPTGVRPPIAQLEAAWVSAFRTASPFVSRGASQPSNASRAVIEGWMHDTYSIAGPWSPVMAITFEGTYQKGPDGMSLVTAADYRALGAEMGRALLAYVGRGTITAWGRVCEGAVLSASIAAGRLTLSASGLAPSSPGALALGLLRTDFPLPVPSICSLGVVPAATASFNTGANGQWSVNLGLPPVFCAALQALVLEPRGQPRLVSTNGLTVFFRQ